MTKEERRLIEKLTAGRSIDGISTGRRSIDIKRREQSNSPTEEDRSIDGISTLRRSIDSKEKIDRSTAGRSIDSSSIDRISSQRQQLQQPQKID
jgi:hypothetical protein